MATKKAASTKKTTVKKPVAAKTTVRTVRAEPAKPVSAPVVRTRKESVLPNNIVNVVFAELVGTFVLTLVALLTFKETGALYVGLVYAALMLAIGVVSGSHLNPAVTFGLWTVRRLRSVLLPFYWGAQFLGAMLAVIVINWLTGGFLKLNFDHIWTMDWTVFGVELVAAAVFLFGYTAVVSRRELTAGSRAFGVGLSLLVGLLAGGSLLATAQSSYDTSKWASVDDIQHGYRVKGVTANPAVALASTEATNSSFTGQRSDSKEKMYSRFTLDTVLGTLVGAALGGNLYLLVAGARRND
jgi:aquaporin Z